MTFTCHIIYNILSVNVLGLGKLERDHCPLPHHIRRLAAQLSTDECRELAIMLGSSIQEWNDIDYQFRQQPQNDLKFTALWSCVMMRENFNFDGLQHVIKKRELSEHILCEVISNLSKKRKSKIQNTLTAGKSKQSKSIKTGKIKRLSSLSN